MTGKDLLIMVIGVSLLLKQGLAAPSFDHSFFLALFADRLPVKTKVGVSYINVWQVYVIIFIQGHITNSLTEDFFGLNTEKLDMNKTRDKVVPSPLGSVLFFSPSDLIDYSKVYDLVMNNLQTRVYAFVLTDTQISKTNRLIKKTQKLVGESSLAALGFERGDRSQLEVLALLAEFTSSGYMTKEQESKIKLIATDAQVSLNTNI